MQNAKPVLITALLIFAILAADSFSQGFDKLSLIGFSLDVNTRLGTLKFDSEHHEDIDRPALLTGGFVLGKRWSISPALRLQISADIKYGEVVDDTLPARAFSDGIVRETAIHTKFLYGGCVLDFQYPLSVSPGSAWFLHGGGGGHIIDMGESEVSLEPPRVYIINSPYPVSQIAFSTSMHGGLGLEIIVSPRFGFVIDYSARLWYPVHYGMTRDFFPYNPVHYHERFISHELDVLLLVRRR